MLKYALKEWAVICKALAQGRQALLLRKGGIAEPHDEFQLEHTRFWLYPTYTHQQQTGIRSEASSLLKEVEAERPREGTVRLTHYAEVSGIYHVRELAPVLLLASLHLWSEETVRECFAYRWPGLYVVPIRVYRVPEAMDLPEASPYAGCRSWVELESDLSTEGAVAVVSDHAFEELLQGLDAVLNPTAFA